jgi:hypothetical protein
LTLCKIKIILKWMLWQEQHACASSGRVEHSAAAEYGSNSMSARPDIGEWYRIRGGELLEVVAIDEDDSTIEVQYFDGTVEELDLDDWKAQRAKGEIDNAEAPEDWSGSADVEGDEDALEPRQGLNGDPQLAGGLEGLDLFDSTDSVL